MLMSAGSKSLVLQLVIFAACPSLRGVQKFLCTVAESTLSETSRLIVVYAGSQGQLAT